MSDSRRRCACGELADHKIWGEGVGATAHLCELHYKWFMEGGVDPSRKKELEDEIRFVRAQVSSLQTLLSALLHSVGLSSAGDLSRDVSDARMFIDQLKTGKSSLERDLELCKQELHRFQEDEVFTYRDRLGQRARVVFSRSALLHAIAELAYITLVSDDGSFRDLQGLVELLRQHESELNGVKLDSRTTLDCKGKVISFGSIVKTIGATGHGWLSDTPAIVCGLLDDDGKWMKIVTLPRHLPEQIRSDHGRRIALFRGSDVVKVEDAEAQRNFP